MARRGEADLPQRADVLDAAVTVLLEKGYEAASVDIVAKAAGISRRTLFNHFESKEALMGAALEHFWRSLPLTEVTPDVKAIADPALGLRSIGSAIATFFAPPKVMALTKMIIADANRFPTLSRSTLGKIPAMSALPKYLADMSSNGSLEIPDAELATRQFVGMILHPLLWMRLLGGKKHEDATFPTRVVEEAVTTFLARYGGTPRQATSMNRDHIAGVRGKASRVPRKR